MIHNHFQSSQFIPLPLGLGRGSTGFVPMEKAMEDPLAMEAEAMAMEANQEVLIPSTFKITTPIPPPQCSTMEVLVEQDLGKEKVAPVCSYLKMEDPTPYYIRLRQQMKWWLGHGSPQVISLVAHGVPSPPLPPVISLSPCIRSPSQTQAAIQILEEYRSIGAVKLVSMGEVKHLMPWFVIEKMEEGKKKVRFISDCRQLNQYQTTPLQNGSLGYHFPSTEEKHVGGR